MTAADYLLEVRDLTFSYPAYGGSSRPLFNGLSLALRRGELLTVLGPPEAGKTSLSRILAGLVPRYTGGELTGELRCMGVDLRELPPHQLISCAGLVFQDPHEQLITSRCDTEVAFALESLAVPPAEIERRVEAALDFFALADRGEADTATLSGGEKKKLLLAAQYALDPPVWILDETLEELDSSTRSRLLSYLRAEEKSVLFFSTKLDPSLQQLGADLSLLRGGQLLYGSACEGDPLYEGAREAGLIPGLLPRSSGDAAERRRMRRRRAGRGQSPLLEAAGLRFSYPGAGSFCLQVERLTVREGEVLALAGPNGCGKSTLGLLLCGLKEPAEGRVSLLQDGRPRPLSSGERSRRIAYMFQNPDYQIFLPTLREELAFGLERAGLAEEEIERRTDEAISRFSLPAGSTPPALLSYGARKRLQAATYYLLDRGLYILDEADAGLSYTDMVDITESLQRRGSAVLLITHDAFLAADLCDRVALMEAGRISEVVDADEYRRRTAEEGQ